jgi:hypothetical protein
MDLTTLSQLAQVFGALAVVIAIVLGLTQVRQFQQQRLDAAALELMRSLQDREFTHAFRLIYAIPGSIDQSALRALGPEHEDAAISLGSRLEATGLLVFRGSIPIDLVEQMLGGTTVLLWRQLRPWAEQLRAEKNHPLLFEWFQWLAERIDGRGRLDQVPAYHRYKDWKSPP